MYPPFYKKKNSYGSYIMIWKGIGSDKILLLIKCTNCNNFNLLFDSN